MSEEDLARDTNRENESQPETAPEVVTESYGTGVHPVPRLEVRDPSMPGELAEYSVPSPGLAAADEDALWKQADVLEDEVVGNNPVLTGGDIDAAWEQADTVGDEAVGGTVATPDQDTVEGLTSAVGLDIDDDEPVQFTNILEERDDSRWELDPLSSDDYQQRQEDEEELQ